MIKYLLGIFCGEGQPLVWPQYDFHKSEQRGTPSERTPVTCTVPLMCDPTLTLKRAISSCQPNVFRILARVPDPGAKRVPELTVIVWVISIAQVTHGEEGYMHV